MKLVRWSGGRAWIRTALFASAVGVALPEIGVAQTAAPYRAEEILELLAAGVPEGRIMQRVAQSCVVAGASSAVQDRVARAGGSEELGRMLERFACPGDRPADPITAVPTAPPAVGWAEGVGLGPDQFVLIQPGTFQMGSTNGDADERPVHAVTLTQAFYLQKTEVTQEQWRSVMGSNPSHFDGCGDDCPVESVSWNDTQDFIARLNMANPGANYRLPTEAEWEYAARAETSGDYGATGDPGGMGWYSGNSSGRTHPVAQKRANAWGLYDMHGNVWEWVLDWYSSGYYAASPATNPSGPLSGTSRVLRGGSWDFNANYARSAYRVRYNPNSRYNFFGFRLARTP